LQLRGKLDAVALLRKAARRLRSAHASFQDFPNVQPRMEMYMKCAIVVKVAAAAVVVAGLVACADLKPLQAEIDNLKSQVSKLQFDLAVARSTADSANSAAQSAKQAASGAQSTANQALAAAQASQSCCDATNEKIDGMFKRPVSR
jgi:hypothetical protein